MVYLASGQKAVYRELYHRLGGGRKDNTQARVKLPKNGSDMRQEVSHMRHDTETVDKYEEADMHLISDS